MVERPWGGHGIARIGNNGFKFVIGQSAEEPAGPRLSPTVSFCACCSWSKPPHGPHPDFDGVGLKVAMLGLHPVPQTPS